MSRHDLIGRLTGHLDAAVAPGARGRRSVVGGAAIAMATVAIALLVRIGPLGGLGPLLAYITLYPAVTIAAALGGYRAGLLATVLSAIGATVLLAPIENRSDVLGMVTFLFGCLLIVAVTETMARALARAAEAEAEAAHARERQEVERRLRWALQAAKGGVWDWDLKTGDAWWSPEMYRLWGVAPGTGMRLENSLAIVHPDDRDTLSAAFREAIDGGQDLGCEFRLRHEANGERWMRSQGEVVRDEAGAPTRLIGLTIDITEGKRAEAALAQSEARFRAIVDTAAEAIVTIDEAGTIRTINPAAEQIFGYTGDEAAGRNVSLLMPRHFAEKHDHYLAEYKRTGVGHIIGTRREVEGRRKDGSVFPLDLSVAEWNDATGQRHFTGIIRDISARKQAEEALRKFSRVIEQTASTVIITDAEGIIEYVNPRFTETTGYAAEEAIGQRPSLMKSGRTPASQYETLWPTIKQGRVWQGEFCNRRKDGTLFWEAAIISPVRNADGEITHFAAIKEDITRRKQDEDTLAHSQRLEAVGQLAGAVAHDFNNLLSVIVANLELIELRIQDDSARRMMRRALEAAETGVSFNRRLLSLASKRMLEPERLDLNDRIGQAATLLERILGARIDFSLDLAVGLWPVRADPGGIDSAILNLAMNARDAMPDGGQLVIATRNLPLDASSAELGQGAEPGDYVRLTVSDDGQGMPPEVRKQAFDPFFTTKSEGKGTGLGLSSVFTFARQSDGFVSLVSEPGEGTTVSLYLPRTSDGAARTDVSVAPGAPCPTGRGELILLVEDDARVREVTRQRLETLGYDVLEAASGHEAIELLEADDMIALVFTDIVMPGGMSGYDVADWTLTHKPSIGVLLTSAHDAVEPSERRVKAERQLAKLNKPYTLETLARSIHATLTAR